MKTFAQISTDIGALVERKNAAYGSSFARSGDYLRILYPDGLRAEQYDDALLLIRDFDKSMRIATDRDALGENPWSDKAGYAILGVHMHQAAKEGHETCLGTVRVDVGQPSTEQGASAAQPAAEPTTGSARNSSAPSSTAPSPQPSSSTSASPAASAPDATGNASSEEDGQGRSEDPELTAWHWRNQQGRCAWDAFTFVTARLRFTVTIDGLTIFFCSEPCKLSAMESLHLIPPVVRL